MRSPSPTVCAIQHINCETPGRIADALAAENLPLEVVRPAAGASVPASIDPYAGLVVMGGPMGVYEQDQYPFLRDELRLIEQALRADIPILGVCLGSQLLAAALGAQVRPGPQKEIGWFPVTLTPAAARDALWAGAPSSFTAYIWHGDSFDVPSGAVSLASSELTACQAFRYGRAAYGILCHLEVTEQIIRAMVRAFAGELRHAGIDGREIINHTAEFLPRLKLIGDDVFTRWARLQ